LGRTPRPALVVLWEPDCCVGYRDCGGGRLRDGDGAAARDGGRRSGCLACSLLVS
jgi:hypothetical protein